MVSAICAASRVEIGLRRRSWSGPGVVLYRLSRCWRLRTGRLDNRGGRFLLRWVRRCG